MNVRSILLTATQESSRSCRSIGVGTVFGAIMALALCDLSGVQANTISFQNGVSGYTGTRDTYLNGQAPDNNNGADTVMPVFEREVATNNFFRDLVGFNLSSLAPNTTVVTGATLTLNQVFSGDALGVVNSLYVVAGANSAWTQSGATWNNLLGGGSPIAWAGGPGLVAGTDYNATPVATAASPATGHFDNRSTSPSYGSGVPMTFTLDAAGIAAIQDWINNPSHNSGFFMRQPDQQPLQGFDMFASTNNAFAALNPQLTLTFQTVPEPSSYLLMALGMAGLWVVRRRRSAG